MGSTETTAADAGAQGASDTRRRGGRLLVAGIVLALLALSGLGWWWRHPEAFGNQGNAVFIYNHVGTTALLGLAQPLRKLEPDTVTVHSVEPQVIKGNATIDVFACGAIPGKPGVGAVRGALDEYCEWHQEAEGATLRADDQLILRVRSEDPGRLVVRGVKVTYSYGWQRGSQVTGQTVQVTFGRKFVRAHIATSQ